MKNPFFLIFVLCSICISFYILLCFESYSAAKVDGFGRVVRGGEGDLDRVLRCAEHGVSKGIFCRASTIQLINHRALFDGRDVIVQGYVGSIYGDLYLFPTKDFYMGRDVASSIRLMGDVGNGGNYVIFGRFSILAPETGAMEPVGSIEIIHAREGYNGN